MHNKKTPVFTGVYFCKLQAGEHGCIVLGAQIAANLTGSGVAIDHGEKVVSTEENSENEKNSQHKNASLS